MTSPTERRKAILLLVITAVLWSTSGVFVKALEWQAYRSLPGVDCSQASCSRSICAACLRTSRVGLYSSLGGSLVTQFLFVTSTKLTTAANSILLQYTTPIYAVLLGYWLLREKPSRNDWIPMGIIFVGLLLFFGDQLSPDGFYGNLLAVLSGVTSAIMIVSFRAQKNSSPEDSVLIASLVSAILGVPSVLRETWTVTSWLTVAYLGIFQIGLAFILFT